MEKGGPMKNINSHKDLDFWKTAMDFVTDVYEVTGKFPENERYGLTSQIRRAAVSIPSNLAEGSARSHLKEIIQFLYMSLGSIAELDTQFEIARRLSYISADSTLFLTIERLRKMNIRLIQSYKRRESME
jgi:four helix bundle protein